MSNKRIRVSELDFDGIKANLKEFLRGQDTFSDYDFEGSNLSVLLDILAYNTHYNAMYTNFALNEVFLDSASKRDSVVSLARGLGYMPRSATCASSSVTFSVSGTTSTPANITLGKNLVFYGNKDGFRFNFYTTDDITATYNVTDQKYTFTNIPLLQGSPIQNTFAYSAENKYSIPNTNIDTNTIRVTVQTSAQNTSTIVYTPATNYAQLTSDSYVYFLTEMDGGFYRLHFGDGILGKPLVPGNIIRVEYMVSGGSAPNNITTLAYGGTSILGSLNISVTQNERVTGGREPETIDEIKFNAPNMYAAQNRAVTVQDYTTLLKNKVASIGEVLVWGGESNDPPVYGSVFVSAITPEGYPLTTEQQYDVTNTLESFKLATIQVRYQDAEFLEVGLDVTAYYDQTQTNKTPDDLRSAIYASYNAYNTTQLAKFDAVIRNSALIRTAEKGDASIINVIPKLKISYKLNTLYNTRANYDIKLKNPMLTRAGTFSTTGFYCTEADTVCYIDDHTEGVLTLFTVVGGTRTDIRTVGSVNYQQGSFVFNTLTITSIVGSEVYVSFIPASPDVVGFANKIVRLDMTKLNVTVIADSNINGQTKNSYNFVQI